MRERLPLPEAIKNAPELFLGLELYFDAFLDLTSCRSSGWSVQAIPWSMIKDYGETNEYSDAQMEDLFYHIRLMDNAYLEHCAKKEGNK